MQRVGGFIMCVMLAGCSMPSMHVRPPFLKLPDGDDPYSTGFRDGCDSSFGIAAAGPVRTSSDFSYDANRGIEDKKYYDGYRMGSNYCLYFLDPGPL